MQDHTQKHQSTTEGLNFLLKMSEKQQLPPAILFSVDMFFALQGLKKVTLR